MDSNVFYLSARARLHAVTDDADAIAAFDRLVTIARERDDDKTEKALFAFVTHAERLGLSLDWVFMGSKTQTEARAREHWPPVRAGGFFVRRLRKSPAARVFSTQRGCAGLTTWAR